MESDLCYKVTEILAELSSIVLWEVELVSKEIG